MTATTPDYDWAAPRTAHAFTGYAFDPDVAKPSGLVVRTVTHTPVPVTLDDVETKGQRRIIATILGFPHIGFVKAPYKKAGKNAPAKRTPTVAETPPKPLLEVVSRLPDGQPESVRVYNFLKVNSNFDKGERDDASASVLRVGQVLTFYLTDFNFEKDVFPAGMAGSFPAFTVLDVTLNPSHNASEGFGVKIARVRQHPSTLYSYMTPSGLERLPRDGEQAARMAEEQAGLCEPVAKCVERSRYSFYSAVNPLARVVDVRPDLDFLRIECPPDSGATPVPGVAGVDISLKDLQAFTNHPDDAHGARTFVDLAIAAGALRLFVVFDDYFNRVEPALAQHRGVPLVDVPAFLDPVKGWNLDPKEPYVLFPAPWRVAHSGNLQNIGFLVATAPRTQQAGQPRGDGQVVAPPSADLPLVSSACAYHRGYKLYVGNPGSGAFDIEAFYVLDLVFDALPAAKEGGGGGGAVTGYKRVRFDDGGDE